MKRQHSLLLMFAALLLILVIQAACSRQARPEPTTTVEATAVVVTPTTPATPAPTATAAAPTVEADATLNLAHLHPQANFILLFDLPMNPDSVEFPLLISPPLEGTVSWSDNNRRLTFTPNNRFAPGESYLFTLHEALAGENGRTISPSPQWPVEVAVPPRITHRTPAHTVISNRRPEIRLAFNRAMDKESVAEALSVQPAVPLNMTWQENDLIITPAQALEPDTNYNFVLQATARDSAAVALSSQYRWTYKTREVLSSATWPTQNNRSAPITLRFSYSMDKASVQENWLIEPAVNGDFRWSANDSVATFMPRAPLPINTQYTIRFTGTLVDQNGDPMPAPEPLSFVTPPPILFTKPGGPTAHPANPIEITFDRPVDQEKTAAAFQISPATTGSITWQETTLIFIPEDGYLLPNTDYVVTITTAAVEPAGQPLFLQPYSWSFTTSRLNPIASFGWGPNAQVLHAGGRRAIQYSLVTDASPIVTFELYSLSSEQFLDRYSSGFRGVAGWQENFISTADTQLLKRWQVIPAPKIHNWANVQEVVIPDDVPPGLYILDLKAGFLNDQLILLLTHNMLAVKEAEGQLVAWVTNVNGGIVPGIEVGVYARDGRLLDSGRTDEQGIFRTRVDGNPQPLIVLARDGNDVTASGLSNEWRQGANPWGGWWQTPATAAKYAAHIYTDRPIYRPGQTVFFKTVVRQDDDALLSLLPAGTTLTARIRDSRNNVVQTFELETNHFGTVHGQFQVAEGAGLGNYQVEIVLDGESHRQLFKVEDYRKPDYQVTVTPNATRYMTGDTIEVVVESGYFFGEPVANAPVTIHLFQLGERYWGEDDSNDRYIWYKMEQQSITGQTDAHGRFTLTLPAEMGSYGQAIDWPSNLRRSAWAIEATVNDGSNQSVSAFAPVTVFNAAEKVKIDTGGFVREPGQSFNIQATVSDIFDRPVNGRDLTLHLRRYNPQSSRYDLVMQSLSLTTGENGQAIMPFTISEPGYYQIYVTGQDRLGNEMNYTSWIYAFSRNIFSGWYGRSGSLSIEADHATYAPGETARLFIESAFSGPALLTFERGTTRREQLVELTAPLTVVEIPMQSDDVPNIFVTVNVWQEQDTQLTTDTYLSQPDSRLLTASVRLSVPATDKILNVTITPDQASYQPREEATFTLRVTNHLGDPVSAELSLALVDEAIFALSEELSGPIYNSFYYQRPNIVRTFHSMAPVRDLGGGGLGGGGGGDLAGNPRSDFPDTAEWLPVLHTDANGEVVVTLTLPDSLTSWRLTAKATTADTQVGQNYTNIITRQDIVVRPILPRILTAGDNVQLSALVHNYSDQRQVLAVSLVVTGTAQLAVDSPLTQSVTLAAGEVRVIGWSMTAVTAGEGQMLIRAGKGDETMDAVLLAMPVRPLAVPDVTTQVGQFTGELVTSFTIPEGTLDMSSVRLELSRSIAGTLLEGLDYLTGFPYGCVEQTMSRALPNAVVGRAFHQLGVGDPTMRADLPPKINAGLQRLYGFQHNDGGWGWWYDDNTDAFQTAWVIFGLAITAEAGYEVDPEVITRGVAWLNDNLSGMPRQLRAYALYSMATAGHGNLSQTQQLAKQSEDMDPFSQAALALALHKLGDRTGARELVDLMSQSAVVAGDGRVYWTASSNDGQYNRKMMASSTRSTALALSAFSQIRPNHELIPGTVRWLMSQRQQQGWGTTNETAYAIIGLTDHLLATSFSESATSTTYTIILNGETIAGGSLGRGEPAVSLEIPAGQMKSGANNLRIVQSGGGRLYYTLNNRVYLAQEEIEAAGLIEISRAYLDPQSNRPITTTVPGQLVKVEVTVTMPEAANFMIVEDSLPGGLEALNENLNNSSHIGNVYEEDRFRWRELGYNYKEVRGDRVSFFITEMRSGRHTFTYMARATHAGAFVALPAEAYAMYDLATWGRSASNRLLIAE